MEINNKIIKKNVSNDFVKHYLKKQGGIENILKRILNEMDTKNNKNKEDGK